jgi:hypothetical protein
MTQRCESVYIQSLPSAPAASAAAVSQWVASQPSACGAVIRSRCRDASRIYPQTMRLRKIKLKQLNR